MKKNKIFFIFTFSILCYFIFNGYKIYSYSFNYSEQKSDVGIVLGAGTSDNNLSPVFKERVNHVIYLYNKGIISKIIFTGGFGENQTNSDSEVAKTYTLKQDVPNKDILIETKSKYTFENIHEAKILMDSLNLKTALLISDPFHMKRSMDLAANLNIDSQSSPTKTSLYKSFFPKLKSLFHETFYYTLGTFSGNN